MAEILIKRFVGRGEIKMATVRYEDPRPFHPIIMFSPEPEARALANAERLARRFKTSLKFVG